jgi:hypothetical protein
MRPWIGWPAPAQASTAKIRLTWTEWCAFQQHTQQAERRRRDGTPFSDRELARLSFERWRYQTGRFVP